MKDLREMNHLRDVEGERQLYGVLDESDEPWCGVFRVPVRGQRQPLLLIVSRGKDDDLATTGLPPWDHVSVSLRHRCPTWEEMDMVKRLFFLPDETAMQLHVDTGEHISNHPYCLHIWRPCDATIPLPPSIMVGYKDLGELVLP